MMQKDLIDNLVAFLKKQREIVAVYLFGSSVTDKVSPLSDVDLALLLDRAVPSEEYLELRMSFGSRQGFPALGRELDVVILNEAPPVLAYEVLRNGKLIYCRNKRALVMYIAGAIRTYLDTKHLREEHYNAMRERIKEGSFGHLEGSDTITLEKIRALSSKIAAAGKDKKERIS